MRIVYLGAGAAGMYCGTCLHDNTLATGLLELGQEVLLVPTYTPLRTDEPDVSQRRVFYGGINVYLQQKSLLFRHLPWFVDRLLDWPPLISFFANRGISTDAAELGDLTVSMLEGESGHQRKELEKLLTWLTEEIRPDVVHLSNALLLGMTREIGRRLNVPVVVSLSGEDIFLERLSEPHYSAARQLLRSRAGDAAGLVAMNQYYADFMAEYLSVPRTRISVISHGLNLAGHGRRQSNVPKSELVLGYFARVCHDKGLHLLAEAMPLLAGDGRLPPWRVRAAGYLGAADRAYLQRIQADLQSKGLQDRFEYAGELDRQGKIDFLQSLDVLAVPTVYRESKGISLLEGLANGVPIVVPAHGAFPELIADTGGGVLFAPEDPRDLAEKLAQMLLDDRLRVQCGQRGATAIADRYHHRAMAQRHLELYDALLGNRGNPRAANSVSADN